jgi:hypothetical protein
MGTRALSSGIKRLGREADHSDPSSAEVKNSGAILPLLHMSLPCFYLQRSLVDWIYELLQTESVVVTSITFPHPYRQYTTVNGLKSA